MFRLSNEVMFVYWTVDLEVLSSWASEASPTLGCSIEISRDIYICVSVVCQINCVGGITWIKHAHAQSQYWAVKSDQ